MGVTATPDRPVLLVVTHNYPREPEDQAGQFIQTLLRPLCDRYRPVVVAPHQAGLALRESFEGIEIVRFRYAPDADETLAYEGNMHEQVMAHWRKRFLFLSFLRAMRRAVAAACRGESPAAAHVHWWVPGALAAAGTLVRRRVPYILTTHGSDVTLLDRFGSLRPIGRRLFRRASACTAVSAYLRDRLEALSGVRAHVLPMPYDDRKFVPGPAAPGRPPRILCIGRLIERKGQRYLIEACASLASRGVDFELQLVGDGPDRAALAELVKQAGLQGRVAMTGNVPHGRIPGLIHESTVVVLPSVRDWKGEVEGLGMVLAEASACGRAVIGTRLGGIPDAVANGESGLLVNPADPAELASALERVLSDPGLAARLGAGGVRFAAQHFSPHSQADRLADIIESVRRDRRG